MLRLTTLGAFLLQDGSAPHTGRLARPRIRALLALLARAGNTGVTRDRLCALLWPESEPERARHSLDQALYLVRRELGAGALPGPQDPVVLDAAVLPSDVADFAAALAAGRWEDAVRLYGGPFLDGFHLSGAQEFERWVDGERSELQRQWVGALEAAAEAAGVRGDTAGAVDLWRRLTAAEPYSSRAVLHLMRALARVGDPGGALETARIHELLLAEEFGATPDPAVAALAEDLRREADGAAGAVTPDPTVQPGTDGPDIRRGDRDTVAGPGSRDGVATRASGAGGPAASPRPLALPRRRPGSLGVRVALAILAVTVLGGGFALREARRPARAIPVVTVLPFVNETGDPAMDAVGRSASDWIAGGLVRTGLVRVAEPGAGLPLAAEVTGRLFQIGDTLRLQARIGRPGTGEVAAVLDAVAAPGSDPAAALESLRKQVLATLGTLFDPRIAVWGETALRPPTLEAYRAFAAGLEVYSAGRPDAALLAFAEAAALDSGYVQPRLWAAWTNASLGRWAAADSIVAGLRAIEADLSPLDAAWLERIDARLHGDHERSFQAARRMVEIAPGSAWTISLVNTALDTRRAAVARRALLAVSPDDLGTEKTNYWSLLARADHLLGEHERELRTADAGIRATGRSLQNLLARVRALAALGEAGKLDEDLTDLVARLPADLPAPAVLVALAAMELRGHGHPDEARRLLDRWLPRLQAPGAAAPPATAAALAVLHFDHGNLATADSLARMLLADTTNPVTPRGLLGLLAATRGDRDGASRWAAELAALDSPSRFGDHTLWRARIAAALQDYPQALALLRQASAEGADYFTWSMVHVLPEFAPMRDMPAFRRLIEPRS